MSQNFKKDEKLCSFKEINTLISKGKTFYFEPFKITYIKVEGEGKDKVLISVPKRNFKRAVKRNLLKRRIREAYRKNRVPSKEANYHLNIMFFYTSKEILEYSHIEQQIIHILHKLH